MKGENSIMLMKVASTTVSTKLAGAIAQYVRETGGADLAIQAIGPASVNQAMKAVAFANQYLSGDNVAVLILPSRITIYGEDEETTTQALRFDVMVRRLDYNEGSRFTATGYDES